MLRVRSLEVWDVGCIEHFRMDVSSLTIIVGENGFGKTTLLSAIENVLDGGHDPDMIRHGCEKATIQLTLSNGSTATKEITVEGSELSIRTADGGVVKKPATYLKQLATGSTFNPIEFMDLDPKARASFLLDKIAVRFTPDEVNEIFGVPKVGPTAILDLPKLNELRQGVYDQRTTINHTIRNLEGMVEEMRGSLPQDQEKNWGAERDRLQSEVGAIQGRLDGAAIEVSDALSVKELELKTAAEAKIAEIREQLQKDLRTAQEKAGALLAEHCKSLETEKAELSVQLGTARANADRQQQSEGVRKVLAEREQDLRKAAGEEARLTVTIQKLDALKALRIKEAPIDGLDIRMDKTKPVITLNGTPLEKLSGKESLFFAIRVASLDMGEMQTMIAETAEVTPGNLKILAEALEEAGIQMICARWVPGAPLVAMSLDEYLRTEFPPPA